LYHLSWEQALTLSWIYNLILMTIWGYNFIFSRIHTDSILTFPRVVVATTLICTPVSLSLFVTTAGVDALHRVTDVDFTAEIDIFLSGHYF
jgi:hypothetical protein